MKIICFDFDNVIADGNLIGKALEIAGDKGFALAAEVLTDSKNFRPDVFYKVIKKFVKLSKGLHFDIYKKIVLKFRPMKNVAKTFAALKKKGHKILIISINDERIIKEYLARHRLDAYVDRIYGSRLETRNGVLTGNITGDVLKNEKTAVAKRIKKTYKGLDIIYIGDGLTDLPVMKVIEKSILFCPSALTKMEVFASKAMMERINSSRLFIVEKKNMLEILQFL